MNLVRSIQKRTRRLQEKSKLWKTQLLDPESLTFTQDRLGELTQIDKTRPLMDDRCAELAAYLGISPEDTWQIPSITNKDSLENCFQDVETDPGLFNNYRTAHHLYIGRMMLAYTRFRTAYSIVKFINTRYLPILRPTVKVLDYGCGVGDYGLAFATQGYRVTLCDILGGNLDFAHWRFLQRRIKCDVLPVTEDNPYPLPKRHQIILAGEVLEHVREPLTVLRNMHRALPRGGLLWHTGYPGHAREVGGDHLQEAADVREEAQAFIETHFQRVEAPSLLGHLFEKVKE